MKKNIFAGLLAIMLTFYFIGCDNGTTPTRKTPTTPLITGRFKSQTGSGDAVFYADYASNARSVSRAVGGLSTTEKELTGKIEDGDIVFNLKGIYDTSNNQFFLSAGSSFLIYDIAGKLSGDSISTAEATVKVKNDDDWTVQKVAVSATSDTTITGNVSDEQEPGLPSAWFGEWDMYEDNHLIMTFLITSFQIATPAEPESSLSLLYVEAITEGEEYLTIYEGRDTMFYVAKYRAEGANLQLSASDAYDTYANAAVTINSPDFRDEVILRRPN